MQETVAPSGDSQGVGGLGRQAVKQGRARTKARGDQDADEIATRDWDFILCVYLAVGGG